MKIKGDTYEVAYDSSKGKVTFVGTLRLRGAAEYEPIARLLADVAEKEQESIKLDLRKLHFLTSSGINVLFRFVILMREQVTKSLTVYGTAKIPWQTKSLKNLQRLMPALNLEYD